MKKKTEPKIELPEVETAYIHTGTLDTVSLNLPAVVYDPDGPSSLGRYGPRFQEYAATPQQLDELVLAIRHKRGESDGGKESLSINEKGIFWKRYR